MRAERLLRVALITDVDPSEALRAGGRPTLAELLDVSYGPRVADVTAAQRVLLRAFSQLRSGTQRVVTRFVTALAAEHAQSLSESPPTRARIKSEEALAKSRTWRER